ncbi:hypothetical protein RJT34_01291 [Clitoria ternatea]|uniref:Pectate lyase n=1 Tax=Clitoria ternatea TaxID=43366 RepID=A0AAN9KI07_CLITE
MEANNKLSLLLFYVFYLTILFPTLNANIGHFDQEWHRRSLEARKAANQAYKKNPMKVASDFNQQVHRLFRGSDNNTRRGLAKYNGPCTATNPIDQCWRCDPNWAKNRKKLANCAMGFGHGTTGGKNGRFYEITDPSDNDLVTPKPGTLRHAVIQKEPLWIIFPRNMNIKLKGELMITSDKTIDARGANVHISNGSQITIQFVKNVIIHGLHIHDIKRNEGGLIRDSVSHYGIRTMSDGDGISIYGSSNIWLDHLSMTRCDDGLIDAIMGSTAITISNCHFAYHNDVMLFGASDSWSGDKVMQITVAFNHFGKGLTQRMPRCRWGFFHVVNNDYTHWLMYAIGGSQNPTLISQGNRYVAPPDQNAKEVTHRTYAPESVWKNWNWRSENDLFVNGAFFTESGKKVTNLPKTDIKPKTGEFAASMTRFTGPLKCIINKPC